MSERVARTRLGALLQHVPPRVDEAYVPVAFFLLPTVGFVLTGGHRPPGPVATALLWGLVVHHWAFLVASTVE